MEVTTGPGRGGGDDAAALQQFDDHAGNARFAGILQAIAIAILPHTIANGAGAHQAGIPIRFEGLGIGVGNRRGEAGDRVGVGVVGRLIGGWIGIAHIGRNEIPAGRQHKMHLINAAAQVFEGILAVFIGDSGGNHAAALQQLDRDAGHPPLVGVPDSVAILIPKHHVADGFDQIRRGGAYGAGLRRHRGDEPEIGREQHVAVDQLDVVDGEIRAGVGIVLLVAEDVDVAIVGCGLAWKGSTAASQGGMKTWSGEPRKLRKS